MTSVGDRKKSVANPHGAVENPSEYRLCARRVIVATCDRVIFAARRRYNTISAYQRVVKKNYRPRVQRPITYYDHHYSCRRPSTWPISYVGFVFARGRAKSNSFRPWQKTGKIIGSFFFLQTTTKKSHGRGTTIRFRTRSRTETDLRDDERISRDSTRNNGLRSRSTHRWRSRRECSETESNTASTA